LQIPSFSWSKRAYQNREGKNMHFDGKNNLNHLFPVMSLQSKS
jgi:hypothetical protein